MTIAFCGAFPVRWFLLPIDLSMMFACILRLGRLKPKGAKAQRATTEGVRTDDFLFQETAEFLSGSGMF